MEVRRINLIEIEYNCYNGFIFNILDLEIGDFEGALFGINFGWGDYLILSLGFTHIEIKRPI